MIKIIAADRVQAYNGVFVVAKSATADRLIFDYRPTSALQKKAETPCLPNGSMLSRIFIPPGKKLFTYGSDLSDFFFAWSVEDEYLQYNCIIREFSSSELSVFGVQVPEELQGVERLACAVCVLPMGGRNSAQWTQECHEEVLGTALQRNLRYGHQLPENLGSQDARVFWSATGVYIDDWRGFVIADCKKSADEMASS